MFQPALKPQQWKSALSTGIASLPWPGSCRSSIGWTQRDSVRLVMSGGAHIRNCSVGIRSGSFVWSDDFLNANDHRPMARRTTMGGIAAVRLFRRGSSSRRKTDSKPGENSIVSGNRVWDQTDMELFND